MTADMDRAGIARLQPFERFCEACGAVLTGKVNQKYCSPSCRAEAWRHQRMAKARRLIEEALRLLE